MRPILKVPFSVLSPRRLPAFATSRMMPLGDVDGVSAGVWSPLPALFYRPR
jgi:hypothetical protein